jgi:uncharacterized protein (DUF1330 family)
VTAYAVVTFDITDRSWVEPYLEKVADLVAKHGGRYLAKGSHHEQVEGDTRPSQLVVLEFPSMDDLRGFYDDPEYRPLRDARIAGTEGSFFLVPGVPDA